MNGLKILEKQSASVKLDAGDAKRLARLVSEIVIVRGRGFERFLVSRKALEDGLVPRMLGPTKNLRAPTLRSGGTLIVGFHRDAYKEVFGS